jgi:hypothetical protein
VEVIWFSVYYQISYAKGSSSYDPPLHNPPGALVLQRLFL